MTIELTPEEKIGIINSHIKNIAYNKYNNEIALLEENSKTSKDTVVIAKLGANISEAETQIAALNAEAATLKP
jgi:CII-binding regulator of phage lambda lysogenization HflD